MPATRGEDVNYSSDGTGYAFPRGQTRGRVDDIIIAVMGSTGTGKSSFIKLLSGEASDFTSGVESETSEIRDIRFVDRATGRNVIIVDTPGFDDSREGVTDTDILKKITKFLLDVYDEKRKLNALIYLHRISDPRFGGQSARNLRMFQSLCGAGSFKNVVVLTTFWDKVTVSEGAKREQQLKANPQCFKKLADGDARFMRHDLTLRSAQEVLKHIFTLAPTNFEIPEEIRVDGKLFEKTKAGSVHSKEVEEMIAKHNKEMDMLKDEIANVKQSNKELVEELQKERAELKEKLAKLERDIGLAFQSQIPIWKRM